jgi:hypothetical protein
MNPDQHTTFPHNRWGEFFQDPKAFGHQLRKQLTASDADTLLHRQNALQAEVSTVLTELSLMERLALAGTATLIGSAALGLLVWRDLDICVVSPGLTITQAFEMMQPMFCHPQVYQIRYANKSGVFNDTGQTKDDRYFFVLQYQTNAGTDWNIDISFWLDGSPRHEVITLTEIRQQLTFETRLAILWIKEIWHGLPAYHSGKEKRAVSSRDIYDAVLYYDVRTPTDFDAYLRERGKPAREPLPRI